VEPQATLPSRGDTEVLLRVRAIGLNFRDVLNVLGEYPGDPGPPGGDVSGVVADTDPGALIGVTEAVFGLGHAPLACIAFASAPLLAYKPSTLSFEQACTMPVVWSTTHVAVERAGLHAGCLMVVHAAGGGVGLKAVEYGQWLRSASIGTAGRPHKHAELCSAGVGALCSSRDEAVFAFGAMQLHVAHRSHMVLNSLSLDFISASVALLGEDGAFEELGNRGIWSAKRHLNATISSVLRDCARRRHGV
jgi:NADPH:quinone reductase-like Zn-dependent oxidoreductase